MAITTKEFIDSIIAAWQALHSDSGSVSEELHVHLPSTASAVGPEGGDVAAEQPPVDADPQVDAGVPSDIPAEEETPVEVYPVVGESRRIKVFGLNVNYIDDVPIGEAWQDETGVLHGTGLCHMMLFEPFANRMLTGAAAGLDTSPLAVFAFRLAMSPFVRIEWGDPDAE